ncbi:hypothetical protein PRIPAC_74555 [Pristionchus pacificus]|uniref:Uncharacterized protein n=1 Tax=Pristionchus pacificus TaxID=54126 RepID=A0A2A6BFD4_PRIPA|nr:hypothetical protein PRIPAC_74555 [Pristionchus pacificus]|eukprot:PDM64594.1 hypothetical protein PRIPAC_52850 [Pristionchus pacificus]
MNDWISVTVGWGIALYLAASLGFRISGANMNPSISFFLLTQGRMSFIRFFLYAIAQTTGAFVGAALCFGVYYDAINSFDGGIRQVTGNQSTAAIFATYPSDYISVFGACLDQTLGAAVLCIGIGTIIDRRNHIPTFMQPALVGLVVTLIASCLALNCGGAINPARDFGPRLFTLVSGYGWEVISYNDYQWFWIPIVCPMIGAAAGAWAYELFIGLHMPDDLEMTLADKQFHSENIHSPHTVEYVPDFPSHRRFTTELKMPIV